MKILSIDIEKLNNSGVCVGCLNSNRKMYINSKIKECFKAIADIEIPDGLTAKVCWECMAYINNMFRFKDTIERSYGVLSDFYITHNSLENMSEVCENIPQRLGPMKEQIVDIPSDLHIPEDEIAIKVEKTWDFDPVDDDDLNEDPILSMPVKGSGSINEILENFNVHLVPMKQGQIVKNETPNPNLIKKESAKMFSCELCSYKSTHGANLRRHMFTHTGEKPFRCEKCSYQCIEKSYLAKHACTSTDNRVDDKPFSCEVCPYRSSAKGNLKRHMLTHSKPFKCKTCFYQCIDKLSMEKHVCSDTKLCEKLLRCQFCSYKCTHTSNFKRHMYIHTSEKPYKCATCSYQCISKRSLLRHTCSVQDGEVKDDPEFHGSSDELQTANRSVKIEPTDQCFKKEGNWCKKKSRTQLTKSAQKNNNSHSYKQSENQLKQNRFCCEYCGKIELSRKSLKVHIRTHDCEKQSVCTTCGFKTSSKNNLMRHVKRVHVGERPFCCDYCSYKCAEKSTMITHIYTHTGGHPYKCNLCSFKTVTNSNLKRHIRTHTGEKLYSCPYCAHKFSMNSTLRDHIHIHTGEFPYSCKFCPYKFRSRRMMGKHTMAKHTIKEPTYGRDEYVKPM